MTRAMWLLNHAMARAFDLAMLRAAGIDEVFTPKRYPQEAVFRSASVDWSADAALNIPADDLKLLNATDWYREPDQAAWAIANRYFEVLFLIGQDLPAVASAVANFKGAIVWRAFGLDRDLSYGQIASSHPGLRRKLIAARERFWLGIAYPHLGQVEEPWLAERAIYLPLGLMNCKPQPGWHGSTAKLFFVCPDLAVNSYYRNIYRQFQQDFDGIAYVVGGSQAAPVDDPHVLGYLPAHEHEDNMRSLRVMYYHSTEPNHVHYHPFEAVRAGMPLVFMAGGMLDRMGGIGLPGRAATVAEARDKVRRILAGDTALIEAIRASQPRLLDAMRPEHSEQAWKDGIARIMAALAAQRAEQPPAAPRRRKIAVILAAPYRGGTLRGALLLAEALWHGSRARGEEADVVLAHLDDDEAYPPGAFDSLAPFVSRRAFTWQKIGQAQARRAMAYAGEGDWQPRSTQYLVPEDGIQQFCDCDAWVVVSDRLAAPVLPVRPVLLMVYDYVQRYVPGVVKNDLPYIHAARAASRVMVTTEFTRQDALQYAGIAPRAVARVPMLACAPRLAPWPDEPAANANPYFVWTTNDALHKNHGNAFKALDLYYRKLGGQLECRITGVGTLQAAWRKAVPTGKLLAMGELDDAEFFAPLSSDYPAMREIDAQFHLNMAWMDAGDPARMARQLLWMEQHADAQRALLPAAAELALQGVEQLGGAYWDVVRSCL
jgi:hypothetical protein